MFWKNLAPSRCRSSCRSRLRRSRQTHERGKVDNPGREIRRGAPRRRRNGVHRAENGHVFRQRVELAARGRFYVTFVRKELIGDAHLDEVGFAREHQQGLVLRLPTKSGDGAVVDARIKPPRYT